MKPFIIHKLFWILGKKIYSKMLNANICCYDFLSMVYNVLCLAVMSRQKGNNSLNVYPKNSQYLS